MSEGHEELPQAMWAESELPPPARRRPFPTRPRRRPRRASSFRP